MQIECIAFDYGSVLAWPPTSADCARVADVAGISTEVLLDRYYRERAPYDHDLIDGSEYWRRITAGYGASEDSERLSALEALDAEIWSEPNEATVGWLPTLKAAGYQVAIISNMPADLATALTTRNRWLDGFDYRIFSGQVGMMKPDPAIYRELLSRLGTSDVPRAPETVLFLDDIDKNVAAARRIGMYAELYNVFTGGLAGIADRFDLPAPPAERPSAARLQDTACAPHMHAK